MHDTYNSLADLIPPSLPKVSGLSTLLGFDGTVDIICRPVETRRGPGDDYTPFSAIRDLGNRITAADGKSALIEIVNEQVKIGGNGPIMANALAESELDVHYIGTLGKPSIHPAYGSFTERIHCHSIAEPAITHALEFDNGKIMLASMNSYEQVTADVLESEVGVEAMADLIENAQLVCLLNWTCLPGLNAIFDWITLSVLPRVEANPQRLFFFDLADPSMRSAEALRDVLQRISRFADFGHTVLGMNFNEAVQVSEALSLQAPKPEAKSLCKALESIRSALNIQTVMAHPVDFAACATADGSWAAPGPHTDTPKITTGAGDNLNAGFCLGLMLGFQPDDALKLGVLYSGYYVRTAHSPHLQDIPAFIESLQT